MFDFFADKLKLHEWDWLAIIIALSALGIAIISMIIAKNTLRSQKQTEINTTPLINKSIQEYLLNDLLIRLFDGYTKICVLEYLLKKKNFDYYPSEDILDDIILDDSSIHLEVFYNDKNNYTILRGFHDMVVTYNNHIKLINKHLSSTAITKRMMQNEIETLLYSNTDIAKTWGYVMSLTYGYDTKRKSQVIDCIYKTVINEYSDTMNTKTKIFDENNCYLEYIEAESKDLYVQNMNKLASNLISFFDGKFIKKKI